MYPNIYLESGFIEEYDNCVEKFSKSLFFSHKASEQKLESLKRVRDLIFSSNIYCDLNEEDIEKSFTLKYGDSESLKEQVIHSGIKRDTYTQNERNLLIGEKKDIEIRKFFCFFTKDTIDLCEQNSKLFGKIILGEDFVRNPFFLNYTFPSESTDNTLYQIKNLKHPCSNLIIIDKFLFKDTQDFPKKSPNLIQVIQWLLPDNFEGKFQVDIITENIKSEYTNKISKGFKEISNYFGKKISLQIFAPKKITEVEASDRFILTNYALISIPHPFDRDSTISCNFYPSHPSDFSNIDIINSENQNIIKGYRTWERKIQLAEKIKKTTPKEIFGTVQYFWK